MPGTITDRFTVTDLARWGRLVKSWATHLDYVSQDFPEQPPRDYWVNKTWNSPDPPSAETITDLDAQGAPKEWCLPAVSAVTIPRPDHTTVTLPSAVALTVQEFEDRLTRAGVTCRIPAPCKNVVIVQGNESTMVLRLPPKETVQGSEDDLLNGVEYRIPQFYSRLYEGRQPAMPQDRAPIMQLHAERLGEYTLNSCN